MAKCKALTGSAVKGLMSKCTHQRMHYSFLLIIDVYQNAKLAASRPFSVGSTPNFHGFFP